MMFPPESAGAPATRETMDSHRRDRAFNDPPPVGIVPAKWPKYGESRRLAPHSRPKNLNNCVVEQCGMAAVGFGLVQANVNGDR